MANDNGNTNTNANVAPKLKAFEPVEIIGDAIKKLRICDSYKNLSDQELFELLCRKAIKAAWSAEFESKPKAQFKARQTVNRKLGVATDENTVQDFKRKLWPEAIDEIDRISEAMETFAEK